MKAYNAYIPVIFIVLILVLLALCKGKMTNYISTRMTTNMKVERKENIRNTLSALYNYNQNGQTYLCTFLEFGSTRCHACRQMEAVMEEIKSKYPDDVNVVFVNISQKDLREFIDYYGIAIIPTQILLDRNGKEYFRHSGYLSASDISKHLTNIITSSKRKSNE